jgi:hypothetical protein
MSIKTIRLNYYTRPDYSYNAFFLYVQIERIYSLILIPQKLITNINTIDKIKIINQKKKYEQSVVFCKDELTVGNNKFYAINIAPGFRVDHLLEKNNYSLVLDNNEYKLDLVLTSSDSPKLLIGNLILSDNFYNRFNDNDNIELNINNKNIRAKIKNRFNKYNYYIGEKITTVLELLDYNTIYNLNSNIIYSSCTVRSLDTKTTKRKGSIILDFYDPPTDLMVSLSSHNTKVIKNTENIGSKLYFTNLEKNNYIIEIFNKYDIDNKYSINYNNNIVDKLNIEVPEFIDRNNIIQSQGLPSFKKKYLKLT